MTINIQKVGIGLTILACTLLVVGFTPTATAAANTAQLAQIQTLLNTISQLQAQLARLQGGGSASTNCTELSRSLFLGSSDSNSAGQVSKLQRFLTDTEHYSYGELTGYYGPATQRAVQAWQAANGVVSSGDPETTGYGVVGPSTRSAMARNCATVTTPAAVPVVEKESLATLTIQDYSESKSLILGSKSIGKELLSFRVDADEAQKQVRITEVPVTIGLPIVKAGVWSDMLKNIVLCSEKTQRCVNMDDEVATDLGGVNINGVTHNEIRVTFDLTDYPSDFTIPKGVTRDFTIIADFNPANTVGGFGTDKGVSAGYVQAVVGEVKANVKIERDEAEGPAIYVKGKSN